MRQFLQPQWVRVITCSIGEMVGKVCVTFITLMRKNWRNSPKPVASEYLIHFIQMAKEAGSGCINSGDLFQSLNSVRITGLIESILNKCSISSTDYFDGSMQWQLRCIHVSRRVWKKNAKR